MSIINGIPLFTLKNEEKIRLDRPQFWNDPNEKTQLKVSALKGAITEKVGVDWRPTKQIQTSQTPWLGQYASESGAVVTFCDVELDEAPVYRSLVCVPPEPNYSSDDDKDEIMRMEEL